MNTSPRALIALITVPIGILIGTGCSDSPTDPETPPNTANMDAFAADLPTWDEFSPQRQSANVQMGDPEEVPFTHDGRDYTCVTTNYSLTENPEEIVTFNPDSEILWLGSLLQGTGYVSGIGSLAELPIRQRAPLTISIDLLTQDNSRTVANPTVATVTQAIGELISAAQAAGHQAGSDIFFDQEQAHSMEQSALSVGLSARYMGSTVTAQLDWSEEFEQNTLTAHFIQRMFTTSVVLPQTPSAFFSDAFTSEMLQSQVDLGRMGPDNLPVFVSNIAWGRIMTLTMTSSRSVQEMRAALSASYEAVTGDGGSGTVDAEHLQVLEESSVRVVAIGGDAENALALLRTGQLGNFFSSDAPLTTAKPISYTVRNLADNSIAQVSETTEYNISECTADALPITGARYRVTLEGIRIKSLGCDVWPDDAAAEVFYDFWVGTINGLGSPLAHRTENNTVEMTDEQYVGLGANPKTVNVYNDGARGKLRIKGDAWDWDGTSGNDRIGTWDVSYTTPGTVPVGDGYYTRSGHGCQIRLYVNITKIGDLYD